MPVYLLPCECGQRHRVTTAQAGDTIVCSCGATLQVPTLRGLAQLEQESPAAPARTRSAWGDRQRVGFLFALGSVTCLLVAGYLWAGMPELPPQLSEGQVNEIVDRLSVDDLLAIHRDAEQGKLRINANELEAVLKVRQTTRWGIGIVLGLALAAAASACFVVWAPRRTN